MTGGRYDDDNRGWSTGPTSKSTDYKGVTPGISESPLGGKGGENKSTRER